MKKGKWQQRKIEKMKRTEKNVQMQWLGRGPQESEDKGEGNIEIYVSNDKLKKRSLEKNNVRKG